MVPAVVVGSLAVALIAGFVAGMFDAVGFDGRVSGTPIGSSDA